MVTRNRSSAPAAGTPTSASTWSPAATCRWPGPASDRPRQRITSSHAEQRAAAPMLPTEHVTAAGCPDRTRQRQTPTPRP